MRILYVAVILIIFFWLAVLEDEMRPAGFNLVETIVSEAGVPNSVSGILLWNRLYDTLFEVFVFTVAVFGVQHYLAQRDPEQDVTHISDDTIVILSRIGAMISGLVYLELSIRGHLGPGGGFAAGVAGGTAIGLIAVTSVPEALRRRHEGWHIPIWEKASVAVLLGLAGCVLLLPRLVQMVFTDFPGATLIPVFNMLIAFKVAIGSWILVLAFIRYRGLL